MTSPTPPRSRQSESYKGAVAEQRADLFATSTAPERERARAYQPAVYPMPACTTCHRFAFPVPTVCYWCK